MGGTAGELAAGELATPESTLEGVLGGTGEATEEGEDGESSSCLLPFMALSFRIWVGVRLIRFRFRLKEAPPPPLPLFLPLVPPLFFPLFSPLVPPLVAEGSMADRIGAGGFTWSLATVCATHQ